MVVPLEREAEIEGERIVGPGAGKQAPSNETTEAAHQLEVADGGDVEADRMVLEPRLERPRETSSYRELDER